MSASRRPPRRLWLPLPGTGDRTRFLPFEIELRAAELLLATGTWDRVEAIYRKYLDLLPATGFVRERAKVNALLGMFCETRGDHEEALRHDALALDGCERCGDESGMAYALGNTGAVYLEQCRFDEARGCFERQKELSQRSGDSFGLARALGNIGIVCTDTGRYDEALEYLGRQRALCLEIGDKRGLTRAEGNIGLVHWHRDEFDRARDQFELTLRLCRQVGDVRMMAITVGNIGLILGETGDMAGAIDCYRQQLALALRLGERSMVPLARENMANEHIRLGQFNEAAPLLDLAIEGYRAQGDGYGQARVSRLRADLLKGQGDAPAADTEMSSALERIRSLGIEQDLADFLLAHAEIKHQLGEPGAGVPLVAQAQDLFRRQNRAGAQMLAELWRLKLAFSLETDAQRRIEVARDTAGLMDRDRSPSFAAQVRYELCLMQRSMGQRWRDQREHALALYRGLYAAVPKHAYRQRIDELTSMND